MTTNSQDISKQAIYEIMVNRAMMKVVAMFPVLGIPVVNPVFIFIAQKLYSVLYDELKEEGALLMVRLKTKSQKEEYQKALVKLKRIIKRGNNESIKTAHEDFKNKLHNLISFDTK